MTRFPLLIATLLMVLPVSTDSASTVCVADPDPPAYYRFELVTTKRVPGSGEATGETAVSFKTTPFGISLAPDGSYAYDIDIEIVGLRTPKKGGYVAWITTPSIDQIKRIGRLDESNRIAGSVDWNKFLVVITLEAEPDKKADMWTGPIALRGISRSGLMHTMAGHGPFENEPCAVYGY